MPRRRLICHSDTLSHAGQEGGVRGLAASPPSRFRIRELRSGGAHKPRSRKNWGAAEIGRVTVFRPPVTTLDVRTRVQMAVGPTVLLISSTNSGDGAGQLMTIEFPI